MRNIEAETSLGINDNDPTGGGVGSGSQTSERDGNAIEFKIKKSIVPWFAAGFAYEYGQGEDKHYRLINNYTLNPVATGETRFEEDKSRHTLRPHIELFYVHPVTDSLSFAPKMILSYI